MANALVGTRYILDTAESVVAAGTPLRITAIHFIGAANADDVILHDGNAKLIWSAKLGTIANTGNQANISYPSPQTVDGLDLDTIDGGTLIVYLARQG